MLLQRWVQINATPVAWALLIVRVLQNLWDDIGRWRRQRGPRGCQITCCWVSAHGL